MYNEIIHLFILSAHIEYALCAYSVVNIGEIAVGKKHKNLYPHITYNLIGS
jgi:glycerol-3-phosphate O-acyltransferase